MSSHVYTHATWRVTPGNEARFAEEWSRLASLFSALDAPPLWGTLIRHRFDHGLFQSFGTWHRHEDVEAMRADPTVQAAFARLMAVCDEATPGSYELVEHVEV